VSDPAPVHVVGFGGTRSPGSTTVVALEHVLVTARSLGATSELFDAGTLDIPMYDWGAKPTPEIERLARTFHAADALVWASPLYHGTVSGLFKNAVDWLEVLADASPPYLTDKPVGLIGVRARRAVGLRQVDAAAHDRRARGDHRGEIRIGDRVVNRVPPKERDVAMVFQNYALYPHMTVRDNMAFALMLAKKPKDEIAKSEVERAAEILGLGRCSTAIRASSRAASASASRWAAPSCATRRSSCSTSRCRTSTPSCASQMRTEIKRAAPAAQDHLDLRHPRPDRGDDDGRPHRR
jgi:NAD(P)H-dependent FMN reductase